MAQAAAIEVDERSAVASAAIGLTSAEARRRRNEFGPNTVSEQVPPRWRVFLAKFWAADSVDARSRDRAPDRARRLCRGRGHRRTAAVQRHAGLHSGRAGERRARRTQEAAGTDRPGPPRRRVGQACRSGAGAGRRDPIAARRLGAGRCRHRVRIGDARPVDAHRRVDSGRRQCRRPSLCRSAGAARPGRRRGDRNRRQAPISDAPPSWCASPMRPAPNRRPCSRRHEISHS